MPVSKDVTLCTAAREGLAGVLLGWLGCLSQHTKPGQDLCTQVMAGQTATLSLALRVATQEKIHKLYILI